MPGYANVGGFLRVIDPAKGQHCIAHLETPLSLNQTGPQGQPGATGSAGATGPTRATGPTQALSIVNTTNPVTEEATGLQQANATCPAGYTLTGGGADIEGNASDVIDSSPDPSSPSTAWSVIYDVPTVGDIETAEAICAKLQ
jgi:hypothetical protein